MKAPRTAGSRLVELEVRAFRNLEEGLFVPSPGFNLVVGENGHGKTNLLEAVYVALTTKSFRAHRLGDTVARGKESALVRATVRTDDTTHVHRASFGKVGRSFLLDDKRPETYARYASTTPIVLFHPGELELSQGGGTHRRKLLDRLLLYLSPGRVPALTAYARALKERQALLEEHGPRARELDAYEDLLVRYGSEIVRARWDLFARIGPRAEAAFERFGSPGRELRIAYATNVPLDDEAYRSLLVEHRSKDARRSSATIGPHRDDLALTLDGEDARGYASQGQHRALVMALKIAEVDVLEEHEGRAPIFLLDDLSSEFDAARLTALLRALRERDAQMIVTSTRLELFTEELELEDAAAFRMQRGAWERAELGERIGS